MNRAISKKLMAIVAIVALVAILGVCLVACNKDDYVKRLEKAGYKAGAISAKEAGLSEEDGSVEWIVMGVKGEISLSSASYDQVTVIKFKKAADAKSYVEKAEGKLLKGWKIERSSTIVIAGTEQGVKDAK